MTTISLLLGVHAHQPVGNFDAVMEDAHQRCYKPFLETLHAYPDFKFAVHFSGWLLDYLLERYPQDMQLLQDMVARGQVEMFRAGRSARSARCCAGTRAPDDGSMGCD